MSVKFDRPQSTERCKGFLVISHHSKRFASLTVKAPDDDMDKNIMLAPKAAILRFYSPLNNLACTRTAAFLSEDHHLLICGMKQIPD